MATGQAWPGVDRAVGRSETINRQPTPTKPAANDNVFRKRDFFRDVATVLDYMPVGRATRLYAKFFHFFKGLKIWKDLDEQFDKWRIAEDARRYDEKFRGGGASATWSPEETAGWSIPSNYSEVFDAAFPW